MSVVVALGMVSVVIPTMHRPEMLRRAVTAVLGQDLPDGWALEVLVVLSDPASDEKSAFFADPRVRVIPARRRGAGAARNAGIDAAHGSVIAFTDDDCVVQPGWLGAAVGALGSADVVQGRTHPLEPPRAFEHSVWVDPPSWQWETCNLVCSRRAVDLAGPFNEAWNSAGVEGRQFGEDVEWGWRMIRRGARPAFLPEALVLHAVVPRTFTAMLSYRARRLMAYPLLVRSAPELRRAFHRGYFLDGRHTQLAAAALFSTGAALLGPRRPARAVLAGTAALTFYLWPNRELVLGAHPKRLYHALKYRAIIEAVDFVSLVIGSLRWRRLVI